MKIPMFKIFWNNDDVTAVTNVIKSGSSWACGNEIDAFEKSIAKYIGTKYCTSFNSGTSALHALLIAYGIGSSDEVIVPSFTFIATANAVLFVGAKPVFADIEEETFGLDPKDVERKITPKTKAIIAVHYGGCPCKIEELRKMADKHNLILIEDAAEAMGAEINGRKVGTIGHSAVLSFCQNKIITTGEGGAVVTDDESVYNKLQLLVSHGREKGDYFVSANVLDYVTLGYNFRMPSMIAALGISQMKKIEKNISIRNRVADCYRQYLSKISGIMLIPFPKTNRHAYQMFTVLVKDGRKKRDELIAYLSKNGIASKVYFEPVHTTKFYREKFGSIDDLPVTERLSGKVLSLPIYPSLTATEISYILEKISKFFGF